MITYLTSTELTNELTTPTTGKTLYYYLPSVSPAFLLLSEDEFTSLSAFGAENFQPCFAGHRRMLASLMGQESFIGIPFYPVATLLTVTQIAPYIAPWQSNPVNVVLFDDAASDRFILHVDSTTLPALNAEYGGSWRLTPTNITIELINIGAALAVIKSDV